MVVSCKSSFHQILGQAGRIGINLRWAWRLKPQLHKHAPAYAGFKNLDFSLVRDGGLRFYSRDFQSLGLNLTPMAGRLPHKKKWL